MIKKGSILFFLVGLQLLLCAPVSGQTWNIADFGAIGDGKHVNTGAIQRAIDSCTLKGGTILVPKGIFLSGTLYLRSGITLHVSEGATLKGSPILMIIP
ncbi:glycosyl hydrolase family 28-related protein [Paraflavitalea speifideaquila]|uniref:glycosyl hydrolase family 28-related protein n=1 Tax=Paraflavitalea speifideaquila TaxID=3076558 RepID=UPI0028E38783|nr:glycosyl hydrolase family 28-related protein [Paraflavitalea speifideiaquila]